MNPDVSVVVPVYNEEEGLPFLFERLYPALDALGRTYEVVFVDDGSRDRSVAVLGEQFQRRPDGTRVVVLARNAGQHMAILAAFQQTRGSYVITLYADLQNPPEEIARLVEPMDAGADYVSTYAPALAYTFAPHPVEIEVAHADRAVGQSKYSLYRLIRLNFDLMTGFSVAPLQIFSITGMAIAALSLLLVLYLALRRLIQG